MTRIVRSVRQVLMGAGCLLLAATSAPGQAPDASTIEIQVADNMKFNPAAIQARPGERLRIVLKGVGKMPKTAMTHNFVLLKKGTSPKSFVDKSSSAGSDDIAPAVKDQVIAATAMVGTGETAEVTFEAPSQAGEYTFVCTHPGHFNLGMKGQLVVK
jgi:azurin